MADEYWRKVAEEAEQKRQSEAKRASMAREWTSFPKRKGKAIKKLVKA